MQCKRRTLLERLVKKNMELKSLNLFWKRVLNGIEDEGRRMIYMKISKQKQKQKFTGIFNFRINEKR